MNGKSLVEMQIPADEIENVDELVRDGYYGSRVPIGIQIIKNMTSTST